jgi:hypothetical protein
MSEEHSGPYLVVAVLCQSVLQEVNGSMSIIRITDQLQVAGPLAEMQPMPITLHAVIAFKAGFIRGKYRVSLIGSTPSKKEFVKTEQSAYFEGEDRGVNMVFVLNMVLPEEGIYWFDVLLESSLVTRIPLRILYQRIQGMMATQPGSSG